MNYVVVSVAVTTALWDAVARRALLDRAAAAARDAGALQVLDTTLWIMSLAELTGGTPRAAERHIAQVRELRRAIGYDAEQVVNGAYLAWSGAPRAQVEAISDAALAMGFGGVHSSGVAALAVRDLAEGHYRDAYARLKPLIDEPFLQVTPLEYADFVEAAVRAGRDGRGRAPRAARSRSWRRPTGRRGPEASRRGAGPWSTTSPSRTSRPRSPRSSRPTSTSSAAAPTCSTASGCAAASAAATPASSCTPRWTSSSAAPHRPSSSAPAPS